MNIIDQSYLIHWVCGKLECNFITNLLHPNEISNNVLILISVKERMMEIFFCLSCKVLFMGFLWYQASFFLFLIWHWGGGGGVEYSNRDKRNKIAKQTNQAERELMSKLRRLILKLEINLFYGRYCGFFFFKFQLNFQLKLIWIMLKPFIDTSLYISFSETNIKSIQPQNILGFLFSKAGRRRGRSGVKSRPSKPGARLPMMPVEATISA